MPELGTATRAGGSYPEDTSLFAELRPQDGPHDEPQGGPQGCSRKEADSPNADEAPKGEALAAEAPKEAVAPKAEGDKVQNEFLGATQTAAAERSSDRVSG